MTLLKRCYNTDPLSCMKGDLFFYLLLLKRVLLQRLINHEYSLICKKMHRLLRMSEKFNTFAYETA